MLGVAARTPAAPIALWVFGGLGVVLGGGFVVQWIRFRIRFPTPEAREAEKQRFRDANRPKVERLERYLLALRAVDDKRAILGAGFESTAIVTLMADAESNAEFPALVYLELSVAGQEGARYTVRTGEYLTPASVGAVAPGRELVVKVDPQDPARVAVDWAASLRLREPAAGQVSCPLPG
ncbi:MAG: hypothetical protein QM767_27140 [Anaeromyxobacter sp.]